MKTDSTEISHEAKLPTMPSLQSDSYINPVGQLVSDFQKLNFSASDDPKKSNSEAYDRGRPEEFEYQILLEFIEIFQNSVTLIKTI